MTAAKADLVRVGALKGPHGLQGWVKAKLDLDDVDLVVTGGPLVGAEGQEWAVRAVKGAGQGLVSLKIEGVDTVEAAARLRGPVFLRRENWPEAQGEVYLDTLVGAAAVGPDGEDLGRVEGVRELPAGPALEVGGKLVPLVDDFVRVEAGKVVLTALGMALLAL